jgi:hypothetical protein
MHFLSSLVVFLTALTAAVSAFPFSSPSEPAVAKRSLGGTRLTMCDLSSAQLPRRGSAPQVPAPSSGLHLKYVMLGRGTQNYTCSGSSSDAPKPAGAVAILYDASCLAAYHPSLLHELIGGFLQFDQGEEILAAAVLGRFSNEHLVAGHHYFKDSTTAVFDFRANGVTGYFEGRQTATVSAPDYAVKGKNGDGDGAVPWLKLKAYGDGSVGLSEGFRIITAGGEPPKTCEGQKGDFEVPYASEYWFYGQ